MPTNELLETKYRAQRTLSEQGCDDLRAYAQNLRRIVEDVERKYGLRFRYQQSARDGEAAEGTPAEPANANARDAAA